MENQPVAYNSMGQILSIGAERYAAYLLSQEVPTEQIAARLQAKFGPITLATASDTLSLAQRMVDAATALQGTPLESPYDIGLIPQNPYLFGGDTSQGRVLLGATVLGPDEAMNRFVSMRFPVVPTPLDIMAQFNVNLPEWAAHYPEEFNKWTLARQDDAAILLRFVERVF
jgi:hypothetical protein